MTKAMEPSIKYNVPNVEIENLDYIEKTLDNYLEQFQMPDGEQFISTKESMSSDKAMAADLNKLSKLFNQKRIEVDKAIKAGVSDFDDTMKRITQKIDDTRKPIALGVDLFKKQNEEKRHAKNLDYIKAFADEFGVDADLVEYKPSWDTASYQPSKFKEELAFQLNRLKDHKEKRDGEVLTIKQQAKALGLIPDIFIETLDRGVSLPEVMTKMSDYHKQKLEDIEREKERIKARQAAEQAEKEKTEQIIGNNVVNIETGEKVAELQTYVLQVQGTKEQLFALSDYMKENSIKYRRLEGQNASDI